MSESHDILPTDPERKPVIEVVIDEEVAQGIYSNVVVSNYTQEEFVLDFLFLQPQAQKAKVRSRVVMTPANAKRLAAALRVLVHDYEDKFGPLSDTYRQGPDLRLSMN